MPLTTAAKEVCGQDLGHLEDARQRTCQGVALHPRGQGVLHLSLLGATAAALRGLMAGGVLHPRGYVGGAPRPDGGHGSL